MSTMRSGVRVGAVTFLMGLSMAGPQAVGVAAADAPGSDSGSISAGPASPSTGVDRAGASTSVAGPRTPPQRAGRVSVASTPSSVVSPAAGVLAPRSAAVEVVPGQLAASRLALNNGSTGRGAETTSTR